MNGNPGDEDCPGVDQESMNCNTHPCVGKCLKFFFFFSVKICRNVNLDFDIFCTKYVTFSEKAFFNIIN